MRKANSINNIVIHCSAGFGNLESIKKFWKEVLGWNSPGYHLIVDLNGDIHQLLDFDKPSNGVAGNNSTIINICYIGGVEIGGKDAKGQIIYKGKDTRTPAQKYALEKCILRAKDWLAANGKDITKDLAVVGHRDFSKDQDGNGIIAPWERIKECPSFDAIKEYLCHTSEDRKGLLPTVKTPRVENFVIYSVVSGDTLGKIAKKYNVKVEAIKSKNNLKTDLISIGQKLKI